jgi:FAD:protein FMN transferase
MKNIIISILIVSTILSCNSFSPDNYYTCNGTTQGTLFNVTYQNDTELCLDIDSILREFSKSLSNYDSESLISQINNNETNKSDEYFKQMFEAAYEVYQKTNGAFDISLAPVVNAWGFGWEKHDDLSEIDTAKIIQLLDYVGMDKISLDNGIVKKSVPDIQVIGNGIAQGLSVDVVSNFLRENGITNFLVEIGGEVYATGLNPSSDPWAIGVDKPIKNTDYENRETQIILNFSDWAAATSGNYRKYLEIGDKSFGHSIDPRTGFPANNELLSVTVLAKTCVMADAYATAFMVLGLEDSMKIVEDEEQMEAYFIFLDEKNKITTKYTSGFDSFISSY